MRCRLNLVRLNVKVVGKIEVFNNKKISMNQVSKNGNILSETIELLRFPLAIAVIFIHLGPNVVNLIDANFSLFSHEGLFNLLGIALSHVIAHIAVPCFFLISGMLFFINVKDWSWTQYKCKLKSRAKTLLIPYIAWNITPWLLILMIYYLKGSFVYNSLDEFYEYINNYNFNILYNCFHWDGNINWLGDNLIMTAPYNLPLWFLRELIVMVILTPIIYFFARKFNLWYIIILFIAYISRIWIQIPGLNISACFYFSLGAFFSLNSINIISMVKKYRYIIFPLSVISLLISIIYYGVKSMLYSSIFYFFVFTTVLAVFYITSKIVEKYNIRANKLLVSSCFFIYAFHFVTIPIIGSPLGFCNKILTYILPEMPIIKYLIVPFLTTFLCMLVMLLGKKMLPNVTKWYTGNR